MPEKLQKLEPSDFDDGVWRALSPVTVRLLHQVTTPPRGRTLVPEIDVRAFHNGEDAYFLLEWKDEAESRTHDVKEFPDAAAIAFSLAEDPPSASIMMGFESTVNIWQWKANLDAQFWSSGTSEERYTSNVHYTYEDSAAFPVRTAEVSSACQDLLADRPGTVTLKEKTSVSGRGQWREGKWRVILTRALSTDDHEWDAQLSFRRMYVAFAVWNGERGDRGSRKSISDWVILEPTSVSVADETGASSRAFGPGSPREAGGFLSNVPGFSLFPAAYAETVAPPEDEGEPRLITIKAKRFEYMPNQITLRKDERVTIRLESLDVTHGFYLDGYGIDIKASAAEVGRATFVADKTGRFTFRCSETCGEFHAYMVGFLTVVPNTRFHVFVAGTLGACAVLAIAFVFAFRKREET